MQDQRVAEKSRSTPLTQQEFAKKKAVLERARADRAIKGEPTSGMNGQEYDRAEDVVPPPGGQTNQTR